MTYRTGRKPSASEYRSWQRSIPALHADLVAAGLHDVEMLFEYQLPLTNKRADVVLVVQHPQTGGPSYPRGGAQAVEPCRAFRGQ